MFENFPNRWTPVMPLTALDTNPVAAEIAGEKIVLFRDGDDRWHALLDKCPHRGAQLSLGKITDDGDLRCGYHGWRFNGAGQCTRVPLNELTPAALNKIHATALPTREIGGAVWVYTATDPSSTDIPEPVLPDSMTGPAHLFATYHQEWQAHWSRAVENFLDFAHPPYLHEKTIGGWMHGFAENGGLIKADVEHTDFGITLRNFINMDEEGFQLDWYRPNLSVLHFGSTEYNWLHVFCIPVNEQHTRIMTARRVQNEEQLPSYSKHASGTDNRIIDEDRIIVESQTGDVLSEPDEISVATDEPTIVFRRWYKELLASAE